jgi:pimeloyl-ACP methyl ester carboxylesterase
MRGEFVDLDGQRLYCFAAGTRGAGAPIVLVHGAFTSSHLWREVIPRLPDGHRVLVLDLLGHGRSDLPADAAYDVAAHGARLRTLLDVLGVEPACLVGHGLGAAIVCDVAQRAPERVRHLVLANPCLVASASEPASAPRALRRLARLTPIFRRLPPAWLASTLHTTLLRGYRQRGAGSHVLDVYLKPYRSLAGRTVVCAQLQALARASTHDEQAPRPTRIPAAWLFGDAEPRATRGAASAHTADAGRTTITVVPGVASAIPEESPDRVAHAVTSLLSPAP